MSSPLAPRSDTPLHILGCSAFILRERKALVLQRSATERFLPGYWELPGGKVEKGEHPYDTVVREVREEMGLLVRPARPFSLFHYLTPIGLHTVDIVIQCMLLDPDAAITLSPKDHQDFRWVAATEVDKLVPMSDPIRGVLREGFSLVRTEP